MAQFDYRDLYITYPEHPRYSENRIVTQSQREMIVNKLMVLLFTNTGDCIADPEMGCNLEFQLWKTRVSAERIETIIKNQITAYIPELDTIGYTISAQIAPGELRDILILDINFSVENIQAVLI